MNKLDAYKQKLWQIIERECDGSRMSDTKWMEMLEALRDLPLYWRVKLLEEPQPSYWRPGISGGVSSGVPMPYIEGPCSPTIVLAVEWMEIDPITKHNLLRIDHAPEVEKRLQFLSVPYTWEDKFIRVTGHIRKV